MIRTKTKKKIQATILQLKMIKLRTWEYSGMNCRRSRKGVGKDNAHTKPNPQNKGKWPSLVTS